MYQKLLIAFFALFIIAQSNASEIENLPEISRASVVSYRDVEESDNYDEPSQKQGCFANCMRTICTKENIETGYNIVQGVVDIVKDIYDIVK